MNKHAIHRWADIWADIKDDANKKLLLGNGASIAVADSFKYESLYEHANGAARISKRIKKLFEEFRTKDFEYVLRLLWETKTVNKLLHIDEETTSELYTMLKQQLVETITDIHPEHTKVEISLPRIARFMKQFDTVLSLNYDLLVYWAMGAGNDKYGQWFKDGFIKEHRFEFDIEFLRKPFNAEGTTLVFYPHGSLFLTEDIEGNEEKLCKGNQGCLLETVISLWKSGYYLPLFVSEGTTEEKMRAIRQSPYLDFVYHYQLESECDSLVIYGWSVKDEDDHILKALVKGGYKKVAISVHSKGIYSEEYCDHVVHKFDKMHKAMHQTNEYTIKFFESSSEGCWMLC